MVEWSISAFREAGIAPVVVACPPGHAYEPGEASGSAGAGADDSAGVEGGEAPSGELIAVEGGETRSRSVANALEGVDTDLVAIHDAARPLVTPALIEAVIATLQGDPDAAGAIAAAPIADTVKQTAERAPGDRVLTSDPHRVNNSALAIERTLDRRSLWAAQTPQVFRVDALRAALEVGGEDAAAATDEAMLVEAAGGRVLICPAPAENIKVTTPLDLRLAELLLRQPSIDDPD
jgi:2-C-methyl-D-erythritol 4-phosphate cytidylyltransferase